VGMERQGQLAQDVQREEGIVVSRLSFGENVSRDSTTSVLDAIRQAAPDAPPSVSDPRLRQTGVTRIRPYSRAIRGPSHKAPTRSLARRSIRPESPVDKRFLADTGFHRPECELHTCECSDANPASLSRVAVRRTSQDRPGTDARSTVRQSRKTT
jgi:hypothetical protein